VREFTYRFNEFVYHYPNLFDKDNTSFFSLMVTIVW
jgi:hypothetical protein